MSKFLNKIVLLMLLCGLAVDAEAVNIDGINYATLYDGTATVSRSQSTDATEVIIPEKISYNGKDYTVTELSYGCFEGKTNLKSVKLPKTITKIEGHAFYKCTSLSQINIPDAVTSIGANCFDSCTALISIELSDSLKLLESGVFKGCSNLVSITLKNNLKKIDYNCFYGCESLSYINLPESLEFIGNYSFGMCKSLTSVIIPDNVTSLEDNLFVGCSSLISLVVGEKVEKCGRNILQNTDNLQEVWMKCPTPPVVESNLYISSKAIVYVPENSLATYQEAAYWKNCNLQSFAPHKFNENAQSGGLFYKYDKDTESYFIVAQNENESMNYQGLTDLVIPKEIIVGGSVYPVGGIAENAFAGSRLRSLTLAPSFNTIPSGAFRNCKELTTIKLSGNLESIGDNAFAGCDNIISIESTIPVPPVLGKDVFPTSVYANAKLSLLKDYEEAYKQAEGWKNFYMLLYEVFEIQSGDLYFRLNSQDLTGTVIPESEEGPNYNKLFGYGKTVTIPETITYKDYEFKINAIDNKAFRESSIYKLVIPESIKTIGDDAFLDSKITYVDVPSLDYWYKMFTSQNRPFLTNSGTLQINGESITTVTITADLVVPPYAFTGCNGITSLEIGEGITEFNTKYEGLEKITSLVIGSDVVSISANAVNFMTSLRNVKSENMTAPKLPANAFSSDVTNYATLRIPALGGASYTEAAGWKTFGKKDYYDVILPEYPNFAFGADADGNLILKPASAEISGDIVIPSSITALEKDYTISIAENFSNCPNITSLSIPSTLRKIGNLDGCISLKKIILPALTSSNRIDPIDLFYYLFSYGYSNSLFNNHPELDVYIDDMLVTDITIPNGYETIPNAFSGYSKLVSVIIPGTVTSVESGAFRNCEALTSMTIQSSSYILNFKDFSLEGTNIKKLYVDRIVSNASFPKLEELQFGNSITSIGDNMFANATSLKSVTFPATITSIGTYAFSGCTSLSEIAFAESGKNLNIGDYAFKGCTALSTVTIPTYVSALGTGTFSSCTSLSNIVFSKGGKGFVIGSNSFENTGFKTLTIPAEVIEIENQAFANCEALSKVVFENAETVLQVGASIFESSPVKSVYYGRELNTSYAKYYPFSGTSEAFDLTVAASVGPNLFMQANMNEVTFGKGITAIGSRAFYGCDALKKLVIPAEIESIEYSAFENCNNLSDIRIDDSQTTLKLGTKAFSYNSIENLYLGRQVEYSGGSYSGGIFSNNPNLKSIELGRYVTEIKDKQFVNCPNLYSLTIGAGVREINQNAFSNSQIAKVIWLPNTRPQGYEYINGLVNYVSQSSYDLPNQKEYNNLTSRFWVDGVLYVFNRQAANRTCVALDCKYTPTMTNVSVPDDLDYNGLHFKVEEINEYTFYHNTYVEKASIGSSITKIGDHAFNGCNKLKSIFIPNSVKVLGEWAFANCTNLESSILGTGLTEIRTGCFSGDKEISEFMVPSGVIMIGNQVFDGCKGLKRFEVMDRNTQLYLGYSEKIIDNSDNPKPGKPLFVDAELEEVYIGGDIAYSTSVEDGYSPFYRNDFLKKVTIANNETEISDYEFYGCRHIEEVLVGDDVTRVGDYAFSGCIDLKEFSLGSKVASIGKDAFSDCSNMSNLTSYNIVPPVCGKQALGDINVFTCELYVPASSITVYQNADQWNDFFHIEAITSVAVPVKSVSLDTSTLTLNIGEQELITAQVLPSNASVPTLSWESDDINVAMVSQFGNVVAIGEGSCYITATTTDGSDISTTCFVTVTNTAGVLEVGVSDIRIIKEGDILSIVGARNEDLVTVVNMGGSVVYQGTCKTIQGLTKGLHIIVVEGMVFKIML